MVFNEFAALIAPAAFLADIAIAYFIWHKMRGTKRPEWIAAVVKAVCQKDIDRNEYVKGWGLPA